MISGVGSVKPVNFLCELQCVYKKAKEVLLMLGNIGASKSQVCKFGLASLDEAIGGGIPRGDTWLIEDVIGADSTPLLMSFLANGLQSMDYLYVLSTERAFEYYSRQFQSFGINPLAQIQTGRLKFIDGFAGSFQLGLSSSGSKYRVGGGFGDDTSSTIQPEHLDGVFYLRDITNPREINESIRKSLLNVQEGPGTGIRGICLSLSSIIHSVNNLRDVFTFLHNRRAMDTMQRSTTLLAVHSDAHDPITLRGIEHQVDGVLRVIPYEKADKAYFVQTLKFIHVKGKPELTGKEIQFRFISGKISSA